MSLGDRAHDDRATGPAGRNFIAPILLILLSSSPALAQSAEAEVLFRDGRALIKRGQLVPGCDKLAASERLESSVGTLLNLGDCREKQGRVATAWAAFRKAEAMAKRAGNDDKRQLEAGKRATALEPRLPTMVVEVPRRVDGLVVRRDGELVEAAQWSMALPVDPGSYTIIAEAPGYQPWRTTITVAPNARRLAVAVPALERAPVAVLPASSVPAPVEPATPVVVRERGVWSTSRKVSVGLAVVGVGALGAGAYFGLHANDLRDQADERCPSVMCGDAEGLRLNKDAQTSADRANIAFVAGGAVVAAAAVLWFVGAPGETMVAPTVSDRHAGIAMMGSF